MNNKSEALQRLNELLDATDGQSVATSMRLPSSLRDAAALAVEHFGAAPSSTTLTASALRFALETVAMEAALETHLDEHPDVRPTLAQIAVAAAKQDGNPLANRPELIESAAREIIIHHPHADADDVLLWAEAQQAAGVS